ncbi:MAG: methyltransferase domain-containing protein, partial [Acidobacteriota bacterium]
ASRQDAGGPAGRMPALQAPRRQPSKLCILPQRMADDRRYIEDPPAGADAWREVWQENRRYRTGGNAIVAAIRGFLQRLLQSDSDRQKNFNLVLLELVNDVRRDADAVRRDLRGDVDSVQRDMRAADEAIAADVAALRALIPLSARRNDALIAALDQKIETLAVRLRDVTNPIVASSAPPAAAGSSDFLYRRLEDSLRGSEAQILQDVEPYVALAREHAPLVDAGCGRGELLLACRAAGIEARGFDTNERSVADLRARGLTADVAAIPECFASFGNETVGSLAAMHVVEHLPVEALFALFREAARVLRRGGLLMIETPNAESLMVSGSEFWRDPTHLAPRHPAALTLLGREHGFDVHEVRPVHPFPDAAMLPVEASDPEPLQRIVHRLNERLFAPQDLRLILRRR